MAIPSWHAQHFKLARCLGVYHVITAWMYLPLRKISVSPGSTKSFDLDISTPCIFTIVYRNALVRREVEDVRNFVGKTEKEREREEENYLFFESPV